MAVTVSQFCLFFFRLQQILDFQIPSVNNFLPLNLNFCNLELNADATTPYSYVIGAPNGPQNWGNLNPNWTLCGTGTRQSPINLVSSEALVTPSLGNLTAKYKSAPARLYNKGHDMQIEWTGAPGSITIKRNVYELVQAHWHIPSEHTVNGFRCDMELHAVHRSIQGNIAVVGILYTIGSADLFIKQFQPLIAKATSNGTALGNINPSSMGYKGKEYYRYNGSLTTPPCSQNVTWTVLKKIKKVSRYQIDVLKKAVGDVNTGNARPIQPLNGRPVSMYKPKAVSGFSDI